ncbi:MAG: MmcQ/YjbR family DNA-binding protein [Acidobacteria bacterium]|nr:MmcQ/YjbR family DNA-binding protein [Acidobacteriota bacterium]
MDNERIRAICMALPYVAETLNWGHHLVYWAADREIGGKMFAITDLDGSGFGVLTFHCGAERFHELIENDGVVAAPYLAKAHWVTLERWDALRPRDIEEELRRAHALISEKLPKRTQTILAMPDSERRKLIKERRSVLAERAGGKTSTSRKPEKAASEKSAGKKKSSTKKQ